MTLDLLKHLADRYQVSLTAAVLKWVESTALCAAVVVATNGFVSWFQRSTAAEKAGLFFRPGTELPHESVAARGESAATSEGVELPPDIWTRYPVREVAIFADRYEMTISLLVFDNVAEGRALWGEEDVEDAFDHLHRSVR